MSRTSSAMRTGSVRREHFVDERHLLLRATWHLERGFLNLSMWRGDVCVETFHLSISETPRLISLLAEGLGASAEASPLPRTGPRAVPDLQADAPPHPMGEWPSCPPATSRARLGDAVRHLRQAVAGRIAPPA